MNGNGNNEEQDAAEQTLESPMRFPGDLLSAEDRLRLAGNIKGYDISPDMVRLSLVNLYLHGFADPKIEEYDTLTSDEKWTEMADVILANPPFMSPKGGIKPHNRFQVQSKRSEVLFVDYIAEHLSPKGRAAVIVPEGIIFQSQSAYRDLRKMLVENHLAAVISLPAGVFNPYSSVKTSILILDRAVAKASKHIAFFKIEKDGFSLSAQRKAEKGSQLPQVKAELGAWLQGAMAGGGGELESRLGFAVARMEIGKEGDFNLSAERYRETTKVDTAFPLTALGELCELVRGVVFSRDDEVASGGVAVLRANNIDKATKSIVLEDVKFVQPKAGFSEQKKLRAGDIFICLASGSKDHIGKVAFVEADTQYYFGGFMGAVRCDAEKLLSQYLYRMLTDSRFNEFLRKQIAGANINNLGSGLLYRYKIPLPSLELQREIVTEIESYQNVIDGARAVLDNYRPHIQVDPTWPVMPMGEIAEFKNGLNFTRSDDGELLRIVGVSDFQANWLVPTESLASVRLGAPVGPDYLLQPGDVLFVRSNGNPDLVGRSMLVPDNIGRASFSGFTIRARFDTALANPRYLAHFFKTPVFAEHMKTTGQGANIRNLSQGILANLKVPLPGPQTQEAIIIEIESEQALVNGNRDLIARFEKKISAAIARVWGEFGAGVA